MIKKHYILGIAMLALFAFSAVLAASASAVEFLLAEWLLNGAAITTLTSTETLVKLLLEDTKTPLGKAAVVCEGIFDGSVGANGEDEITELLTDPGGVLVTLAGKGIVCTGQTLCANGSEAWAEKLPFHTTLELEEPGGAFVDLIEAAEYTVLCLAGLEIEDTCTAAANTNTGKVSNGTGEVTLVAGPATPNGSCSSGGAGAGVIETIEGLITELAGVTGLSVSSV